jgi:glutathione S-transferase
MLSWYQDALAETWREPGHETEISQSGAILQDLRTS